MRLEEADRRNAFQLALSDALRPLAIPADIVETASELLRAHLGIDRVLFAQVNEDKGTFIIHRHFNKIALGKPAGSSDEPRCAPSMPCKTCCAPRCARETCKP